MSFTASKVLFIIFRPSNAIVLATITAILLAILQWKYGKTFLLITTTIFVMSTTLPIGQLLLLPLEYRLPPPETMPKNIDGVIVLGGGFNSLSTRLPDYVELGDAGDRVTALIRLGRHYPEATLVYSGGSGALLGNPSQAADQARTFYRQQGFDPDNILFEEASRNTWENALYSLELVKPIRDQMWLLVTSASHMPRAVGVFRKLDWSVLPFPVDYKVPRTVGTIGVIGLDWRFNASARLAELDSAAKEWIGLLVYWLTGKTMSILPEPVHSESGMQSTLRPAMERIRLRLP